MNQQQRNELTHIQVNLMRMSELHIELSRLLYRAMPNSDQRTKSLRDLDNLVKVSTGHFLHPVSSIVKGPSHPETLALRQPEFSRGAAENVTLQQVNPPDSSHDPIPDGPPVPHGYQLAYILNEGIHFRIAGVLAEVLHERARQDEKWGEQNHPIVGDDDTVLEFLFRSAADYREIVDNRARGQSSHALTYSDILLEELSEAIESACNGDAPGTREELVQCAAVIVAMIERIDRRGGLL